MPSRKEQVQAHRFVTHRIVSALLLGDPESTETPMRRIGLSVFGSVMIMAIIAAVFGVVGIFKPGGGTPESGTIIIEEETGVRYLYGNVNGKANEVVEGEQNFLYPVLNYASARLILNQENPPTMSMSQNSLRDFPRGRPLGIANAPDALPVADNLMQTSAPWNVCSSSPRPNARGLVTQVVVQDIGAGDWLGKRALLVRPEDSDDEYLLWNDMRLRIASVAKPALGITAEPMTVTTKMLQSLRGGPDLAVPDIPNTGATSQNPVEGSDAKVGTVFTASGASYVLTDRGLVPIGDVMADIITGAGGSQPVPISAEQVDSARADSGDIEPEGFPQTVPEIVTVSGAHPAVCGVFDPSAGDAPEVRILTYGKAPEALVIPESAPLLESEGTGFADRVVIPGGRGVLAQDRPAPGASSGATMYIINQQGLKYGLVRTPDADPKISLGYKSVEPVLIPGDILRLLPSGVSLSTEAALHQVTQITPDATPTPDAE